MSQRFLFSDYENTLIEEDLIIRRVSLNNGKDYNDVLTPYVRIKALFNSVLLRLCNDAKCLDLCIGNRESDNDESPYDIQLRAIKFLLNKRMAGLNDMEKLSSIEASEDLRDLFSLCEINYRKLDFFLDELERLCYIEKLVNGSYRILYENLGISFNKREETI